MDPDLSAVALILLLVLIALMAPPGPGTPLGANARLR
jgi:hypothetical protein